MANLTSNPWSFTSTDILSAALAAGTSMSQNADGTVLMTTAAAHSFTAGMDITVWGMSVAAYVGFYTVLSVPTTTTATLIRTGNPLPSGLANATGGTAAQCQYYAPVRIEDISWQNASAAGQLLEIRDRNANIIWSATATAAGSQNRGKVFWVQGITVTVLGNGIVLMTVN